MEAHEIIHAVNAFLLFHDNYFMLKKTLAQRLTYNT